MTVFLVAVPRSASSLPATCEFIDRTVAAYSAHLGPRYELEPVVREGMTVAGALLVEWSDSETSNALRIGKSWAAVSQPGLASSIIRSVDGVTGFLRYKYPVWGSFAAVTGRYDSDRLFAWSSVPSLDAVYYAITTETILISNRPLAIASALWGDNVALFELDETYLEEYLSFGFSMSGVSPFHGINIVPSDRAISVYKGEVVEVTAPKIPAAQLTQRHDERLTGAEELTEALRSSTQRSLTALGDHPIQLRLSGGKDSRLMLGLLLDAGFTNVVAVTQGDGTSEEVLVARELATLAGIEHQVVHARLSVPTSVAESVVQTIRDSQGMLLSEAAGMPYSFADPLVIGEGYSAGQWPTFKAPYVRRAEHSLEDLDKEWDSHIAGNLAKPTYDYARANIERWVASSSTLSNNELLYLYGRNVRAGNYMQASSVAIDGYSRRIFPFVDSEVTAVADAFPDEVRRSEIPLFIAIGELWPEALRVPLARGGKFRFERGGPVKGISGGAFEERYAKPTPRSISPINPNYLDQAEDRTLLESPLKAGSAYILSSPSWPVLQRFISSSFCEQLLHMAEQPTERDVLIALRTRRRRILTRQSIWRLIAADAWLSKKWLIVER